MPVTWPARIASNAAARRGSTDAGVTGTLCAPNTIWGDEGFERAASGYNEEHLLDDQLRGHLPVQVLDADSTQTIAILDALDGHDMVI